MQNCNFCADEQQLTTHVAEMTPLFQSILQKYFWFQESELRTFQICSTCSLKVMDFHLFYTNVEKLHAAKGLEEEVVGNYEPWGLEHGSEQNFSDEGGGSKSEQLIVGDLTFEIVDVGTKTEPFEEVDIQPDEVKKEEDVETEPLVSSSETTTFDCLNCNKEFENRKILELHMKIVHNGSSIGRTCTKCAELEKLLREILEHGQAELSESTCPVQCVICDGRLQNMASLQRHLVWHWGETCGKCRRKPKNCKSKAKYNIKTKKVAAKEISQSKPFGCPYCEKDYGHINFLRIHMRKHHENVSPDGCQKCKALDQALKELEQDQPTESGRIKCGVCDGWLMSVASLQRHLAWHQSEPCENCRRGRRVVEASIKQHVDTQKVSKTKRPPTTAASLAVKKHKTDEVSIKHICVYCGLCFDVYEELVKHQVAEHPKQRHCKYTSITPN